MESPQYSHFYPGSVVTLSRNDVDHVVTEYGIAPMKGRTVRRESK